MTTPENEGCTCPGDDWDTFCPVHRDEASRWDETETEVTYRCPECDTYSGHFTLTTDSAGEFAIVHSICGREGTVASFDPESPEYAEVYDRDDPDDPWDDGEDIDISDQLDADGYLPGMTKGSSWDVDLTPTRDADNDRRVASARAAIRAFIDDYGMEGEDQETILTDLLANLHHWVDAANRYGKGLDWDTITERAEGHHAAEVAPQPQLPQDVEDARGNLYEPPDEDGRIRVRDLDGDVVTFYDPGDPEYAAILRRFQ